MQIIQDIGRKYQLNPRKATDAQAAAIMRLQMPDEAKALILECWFQEYGQIDATELFDITSVIDESRRVELRAKEFIPIGKSGNGDLLAVHWKSAAECPVGYLRFADYMHPENEMAACFYQISDSIGAFFAEISAGYKIPCDSYQCKPPRRRIPWWHFRATR